MSATRLLQILLGTLAAVSAAVAQTAGFTIAWVNIGEACAMTEEVGVRAGKQLFKAADLVAFSMSQLQIQQVSASPEVVTVSPGEEICMTDMEIRAFTPQREQAAAPLSISIRQDQRERLAPQRYAYDVCFAPSEPGEYPIRLGSMLPAADGSMRGAQFFLHVRAAPSK